MLPWQEKIKCLEAEIGELEIKLYHPHLTNSPEEDYHIKSKIMTLQTKIISIYIREANRMIKERSFNGFK